MCSQGGGGVEVGSPSGEPADVGVASGEGGVGVASAWGGVGVGVASAWGGVGVGVASASGGVGVGVASASGGVGVGVASASGEVGVGVASGGVAVGLLAGSGSGEEHADNRAIAAAMANRVTGAGLGRCGRWSLIGDPGEPLGCFEPWSGFAGGHDAAYGRPGNASIARPCRNGLFFTPFPMPPPDSIRQRYPGNIQPRKFEQPESGKTPPIPDQDGGGICWCGGWLELAVVEAGGRGEPYRCGRVGARCCGHHRRPQQRLPRGGRLLSMWCSQGRRTAPAPAF